MLDAVTTGITTVIGWISTVVNSLIGANGELKELLPLFAITVAISAIMLAVRLIKSFVWGA